MTFLIRLTLLLLCTSPATTFAAKVCRLQEDAKPAILRLKTAMAEGRFIAYEPTALQIINGRATYADEASITEDLKVLRTHFDGLITYGSSNGAEHIPDVARKLGFRAIIMGVWGITDAQEIDNAIAAWKRNPQLVVGLSVGNETVFGKRDDFSQIAKVFAQLRAKAPGLALSTTEPFHLFYDVSAVDVLSTADFLLANVHPVFQPWFKDAPDANAAEFVVNVVDKLASTYCGPILVKETGVPTAPRDAGYSPTRQASFYKQLAGKFPRSSMRAFAYFSAFDAPWRVNDQHPVPGFHPEEAHWGLYDEQRRPKTVVATLPNP